MIYFDNAATTKMSSEAIQKMTEACTSTWANPSSLHAAGLKAAQLLKEARSHILQALGVKTLPGAALVFCGSGTEANNLALTGVAHAKKRTGKILISEGEHACIEQTAQSLEREGFTVVRIPTRMGSVDMEFLQAALDPTVMLVSVMTVNNETGAVYDTQAIFAEVRRRCPDAVTHTDAVQGFFKVPVNPRKSGADLVTISAHKIHGPKGTGALYINPAIIKARKLTPILHGGGQESGFRSGTENVPCIAAFGEAVKNGYASLTSDIAHMQNVRTALISILLQSGAIPRTPSNLADDPDPAAILLNLPAAAAPHILSLTLPNIKSEVMLHRLSADGICISSGSACSSHARKSSQALTAFGLTPKSADCSIRISLSPGNTIEEAVAFVKKLKIAIETLVKMR